MTSMGYRGEPEVIIEGLMARITQLEKDKDDLITTIRVAIHATPCRKMQDFLRSHLPTERGKP